MATRSFPANQDGDFFRNQMAQFFDATTDAIAFLDRGYNFTFLNRRAEELLAPGVDVLGKNLFECFPAAADENAPYIGNYRRSMDHGEVREFEAYYPAPLYAWIHIHVYPSDQGIILFFRSVTEKRAAQEELHRKSEEAERQRAEIESVYRTAPIGLALFDTTDFRYLRLNDRQAAFFGLKPEQIVGRTLTEMAPIEGLRELFEQVLRGEPVVNHPLEGTLITDPTDYRYWLVSYFPVWGPDGSVQAITAASLEITQQRKAEMALLQSEKLAAVGRLASSIAHEINNPLEAITNLLYLARESRTLEESHAFIDQAEVELRRVSAITSQTLRFHKQASNPQAVTAEDLIESVLSVYQGRVGNSGITVSLRLRAQTPVRCFEGEIRQVLSNLFSNAMDALGHGAGGRITLRGQNATNWKNGDAGVAITVADNGSGMSEETLGKLFHAFFTTKGIIGTGLGLWVSKEIIDRHRGTLHVRSSQRPSHHGSTFRLFLPFEAVTR